MPNFETFTRTNLRSSPHPTITITGRATLVLNRAVYEALGSPTHVEYRYDRTLGMIGLQPSDNPQAYRVRKTGSTYSTSAGAFMTHYGITTPPGRRRPATLRDDTLCITLADGGEESASNRTRK